MQLVEFRVRNFRSINDSGPIDVRRRTALVGRNESGKSNLLLALRSLKPSEGLKALNKIKDFPKDRRMSEYSDDLPVVDTRWSLSAEERAKLAELYPRAKDVTHVFVRRGYGASRTVELEGSPARPFEPGRIPVLLDELATARAGITHEKLALELGRMLEASQPKADALAWAESTVGAIVGFRKYLKLAQHDLDPNLATKVDALAELAQGVVTERDQSAAARQWIVDRMPVFIYLHDYPDLEGHMDLDALVQRMDEDRLKGSDGYFLKLMKVAGLDVRELQKQLSKNHEMRQHLANRGGAVVTRTLRRLWSDRALKVRFNVDAQHFDTLVSDPNQIYDVEVNLDERSRGFRWFFSFYVTFAADTEGGPAENAILLLDEPGLYLHAISQKDLLAHFVRDFQNQILYTTHSPFMIPVDDVGSVRMVDIDEEKGTTVSNTPVGDPRTLFPLQAAQRLAAAG